MRHLLIAAMLLTSGAAAAAPPAPTGKTMAVDDWHKNTARAGGPRDPATGHPTGVAPQDHAINEQGLPGGGGGPKKGGAIKTLKCPNKPGCPTASE